MRRSLFGIGLTLCLVAQAGYIHGQPSGAVILDGPQEPSVDTPQLLCDFSGGNLPRTWGSVDYLLWWVRRGPTPPLVVTGSPSDPFPGALDQPGTRILFGDQGLGYGTFNGLRASLGTWIDREGRVGIEAGGFMLERRSASFNAAGDGNGQPFLATPFVNALTGNANVYFISQNLPAPAASALLTGKVGIASATNLWSWETHGVLNLARGDDFHADVLLGFRQTSLREDLRYGTQVTNLAPGGASLFLATPVAPGFTVTTIDKFTTANLFNGGQLGIRYGRSWGLVAFDITGKIAMGNMHESVNIEGVTTTNAPLPVTTALGGIYAQASNIGHFSRDVFAVIPEVGLNAMLQLTPALRARVGYTFVGLSNVLRPGDQIDQTININHVPIDAAFGTPGGPNHPAFAFHDSSFWAQGINFGLEFSY